MSNVFFSRTVYKFFKSNFHSFLATFVDSLFQWKQTWELPTNRLYLKVQIHYNTSSFYYCVIEKNVVRVNSFSVTIIAVKLGNWGSTKNARVTYAVGARAQNAFKQYCASSTHVNSPVLMMSKLPILTARWSSKADIYYMYECTLKQS